MNQYIVFYCNTFCLSWIWSIHHKYLLKEELLIIKKNSNLPYPVFCANVAGSMLYARYRTIALIMLYLRNLISCYIGCHDWEGDGGFHAGCVLYFLDLIKLMWSTNLNVMSKRSLCKLVVSSEIFSFSSVGVLWKRMDEDFLRDNIFK